MDSPIIKSVCLPQHSETHLAFLEMTRSRCLIRKTKEMVKLLSLPLQRRKTKEKVTRNHLWIILTKPKGNVRLDSEIHLFREQARVQFRILNVRSTDSQLLQAGSNNAEFIVYLFVCWYRWRSVKALFFEEIGMLGKKLFHLCDNIGRRLRDSNLPWGGIQVRTLNNHRY